MNKNRKFAADGDIFMNNFSNTLFKSCFSGKSRSYTSLFECVVTVTGVVIRKSFSRLIAFFCFFIEQLQSPWHQRRRRPYPNHSQKASSWTPATRRDGGWGKSSVRAALGWSTSVRHASSTCALVAEAVCTRTGRWMKLNRLVMWSGAVRSRKSLRRQCAMHAAAFVRAFPPCFVDSFNSGVNSVKLNVKSNCVVYFDSCWCFLSTHSLQGCGQARCSRYRVCHQVGEWTESAACLKVP